MSKIDYAFKSYVLKEHNDLLINARKSGVCDYARFQLEENGVISPFLERYSACMSSDELYHACRNNNTLKELKECYKILHASYHRRERLVKRIGTMLLNGSCLFLTLTFNDETLASTTEKERRTAVSRYLKTFRVQYVANIDYGSKNHREHYHAIINTDKVELNAWRKYGNINVQRVRNRDIQKDQTRLAKYITKLTNHAIKETTKRSALIYSR